MILQVNHTAPPRITSATVVVIVPLFDRCLRFVVIVIKFTPDEFRSQESQEMFSRQFFPTYREFSSYRGNFLHRCKTVQILNASGTENKT
jgi:hypothetical protein